ncbi:MAG TPA: hypothetical protein DCL77_01145 [Prolixibacteraceae bacterium]|jgi:hypothetical protein|nr:hypothetical protein [Prolixibacteraceae bacterium]
MKSIFQIKVVILISLFLFELVIFKGLQNPSVFKYTLGVITFTNQHVGEANSFVQDVDIIKTKHPYTTFDEANFNRWDVAFYSYMKENGYGKDDTWPGIGTYAFSPLFPFIWKLTHLPASYMCIVNYLMFACSILLLSSLFLPSNEMSKTDNICFFALASTLPSVFSFYIPYSESTFIFTMSIALWALFKNKVWPFYLAMVLFVLSRPSFMLVGLAFICTDIYFLILNREHKSFLKELAGKLLPIIIGMAITFYIQYLYSGSFFRMFEVHSLFWNHNFQLPTTISDWSLEGYGMSIFSIFCIAIPASILLYTNWLKHRKDKLSPSVSLFSPDTRKEYLFHFSIIYFIGNFLFVLFTQGGNLNGLHRYILVSPFFYIFLFMLPSKLKSIDLKVQLRILIPLVILGFLLLIKGPYGHGISYLDMGYFFLMLAMFYFILFDRMRMSLKIRLLSVLIFLNTVWLTYLFNNFLNNSFIIA